MYSWYKALRRKLSGEKASDLGSLTMIAGLWLFFELGALAGLGAMIGTANGLRLALLFMVNIIVYYLLKRLAIKGRKLLDKVREFKNCLEAAEQEELNLIYNPTRTPKLFETCLPYALVLSVGNRWVKQLTEVFNLSEKSTHYCPTWYVENNRNNNKLSALTKSIDSSLSSAVSSSFAAPDSLPAAATLVAAVMAGNHNQLAYIK